MAGDISLQVIGCFEGRVILCGMTVYSVYIHIPFCIHRCAYCDFNTYAGLDALIPSYLHALCREIEMSGAGAGEKLDMHTIFFGGGTPSLMPWEGLEHVLGTVKRQFNVLPGAEISLEANPGTVSLEYLQALHSLGVNRLSLGMQSASPGELRLLERQHDLEDVTRAVSWARQAGFNNLNLDLIFGLPGQGVESWLHTLEKALSLQVEHLSLYALTLESGTPMQRWVARGLLSEPDPDLAAEMYERATDVLEAAGFRQYEISNWARVNEAGEWLMCQHNLQYWRNQPYLGFGAGAHGYARGFRVANILSPKGYIQRVLHPSNQSQDHSFPATTAAVASTFIDHREEMGETMMTGLRLTEEGISSAIFLERFGEQLEQVYGEQIEKLVRLGLLEWAGSDGERLRLTQGGRLLGNQVFMEFVG